MEQANQDVVEAVAGILEERLDVEDDNEHLVTLDLDDEKLRIRLVKIDPGE